MTTPPPPPGPYGPPTPPSQPSQPSPQYPPYPGAPHQPGAFPQQPGPGYPNPPQPQPGYGYPSAPQQPQPAWGQPGAGQPGAGQPGWGQPGQPTAPGWPVQPPRKKPVKLIVGILVGVLVVVSGVAYGVVRLIDKGTDAVYPKAVNKLVVQKTLLDEEFTLDSDTSDTDGADIEDTPDLSIRDARAVVAQYGSEDGGVLIVSGMYGRIADPEFTRGSIMEGAAGTEGNTVVVPAEEFTPDGYDITIECQVQQTGAGVATSAIPMCAWGDDNTGAMVALLRVEDALVAAEDVDLEKAAAETAKIREEMLEPIN
ncbi:hypothetical protein [Streptomyces sp. NPDC060184]|uniref:hypothetical protein n=1 Tax=Streptomyces sp. NPDC060184 TaxID=3347064 RepID=UPI003649CFCF